MKFCVQCNEEFSALEPACPTCGSKGLDQDFLLGIPAPGEPLETIEDWKVVLRSGDEMEAHLAKGFLEAQGIETILYPDEGATGLERFGNPGLGVSAVGQSHRAFPYPQTIHLLVSPESADTALESLRDLRAHPGRVEASDAEVAESVGTEAAEE
ncbi:MAG: hypothetical protein HZB25_04140 [Candidatus Eisenbacteria bacterium]|nr:hypothetical protein [Candidatus Eisenbacteria bacterium]